MILGIDEVGRGPWAGPLVVGAVVLPDDHTLDGLTDSKKLSAKRRDELDVLIREQALGWGLGWVHADELDSLGLSASLKLATIRAVEAVKAPYHEIIIDGTINFLKETSKGQYVTTLAKADLLVPAVSAASIIAKVARDTYMQQQDALFPGYGFGTHVGYGTAKHQQALNELGVTSLHRTSFAPIAKLLGQKGVDPKTPPHPGTAKSIGNRAETLVSYWLADQGFEVLEQNWKTKWCEIDIIAAKQGVRYFIEVKYRSSTEYGGAIAALTPKKLQQMRFAAELYETNHPPNGDMRMAAITVDAKNVIELFEIT